MLLTMLSTDLATFVHSHRGELCLAFLGNNYDVLNNILQENGVSTSPGRLECRTVHGVYIMLFVLNNVQSL